MHNIHHDSDTLIEQELSQYSDSVQVSFTKFHVAANGLQSDLNLYVTAECGKPLSKALISIDSVGITAISDLLGKVYIKDLPGGRFHLDIISPGYIAKSILISIVETGLHEINAQLISNIG